MTIGNVKPDDLVACDVRGQRFYAKAQGREGSELLIQPLLPQVTFRRVKARQVIGHFGKRAGSVAP